MNATNKTIEPTTVRFDCKADDPEPATAWIVVAHDESETPEIIAALRDAGWQTAADRGRRDVPPLDGIAETTLSRRGTDLFGGWTADEHERFLAEAREIMAAHGFIDVPLNRLPWQEFI